MAREPTWFGGSDESAEDLPRQSAERLVELVPAPPPRPVSPGNARYVLEVGGAGVEFGDDFREERTAR